MKHKQRLKWKAPRQQRHEVFFFVVDVSDPAEIQVMQVEQRPDWGTKETDSLLTLGRAADGSVTDLADYAINISWFPRKPAPESDLRNRGLMAVLKHLLDASGRPDLLVHFGFGHLHGAKAVFDDE